MEGKWPSLSSLDRRICSLFFYWSTWNVFLGAMLGGSAFSQLGIVINNPGIIPNVIGGALPASSNFFINYILIQVGCRSPCRVHVLSCTACFSGCAKTHEFHARGENIQSCWCDCVQGLAMQTFRLMYPHIGSLVGLFRLCGHCSE